MPTAFTKILLFFSAYSPLFAIFTIANYGRYGQWSLIPLFVGIVAVVWLIIFLRWVKGSAARSIQIQTVQRKDSEVMAYIFTYIFPFLGLNLDKIANAIGLGIFFVVLMVLHVSNNMIHINPSMNLMGYHIYEVTISNGSVYTIITRRSRLIKGTQLSAVMVGDELFMEKQE